MKLWAVIDYQFDLDALGIFDTLEAAREAAKEYLAELPGVKHLLTAQGGADFRFYESFCTVGYNRQIDANNVEWNPLYTVRIEIAELNAMNMLSR